MKRVAATLAAIAASSLWFADALAQEGKGPDPIGAIAENLYAQAVLQILDRWNSGELVLEKKYAAADFDARFRKYSELGGKTVFSSSAGCPRTKFSISGRNCRRR